MLWGDFLFRKLKREADFLVAHIGMIGFSAFICCFGGILLWVNGTNIWHILRTGPLPSGSISVTWIFLLWLLTYGLCGTSLALLILQGRVFCRNNLALTAFSVCCAVYLLQLVWYAVFFCTHLFFFALFIHMLAFLLTILLIFLVRHSFMLLKVLLIAITLVELYFIYFNLTFYLG